MVETGGDFCREKIPSYSAVCSIWAFLDWLKLSYIDGNEFLYSNLIANIT